MTIRNRKYLRKCNHYTPPGWAKQTDAAGSATPPSAGPPTGPTDAPPTGPQMLRHVQHRHLQQGKQQNHQLSTRVMPTNHWQQHQWGLINAGLWMMCYSGLSPHRLRTLSSRKTGAQTTMLEIHLLNSQKTMVWGEMSLCQEDQRGGTRNKPPSSKTT